MAANRKSPPPPPTSWEDVTLTLSVAFVDWRQWDSCHGWHTVGQTDWEIFTLALEQQVQSFPIECRLRAGGGVDVGIVSHNQSCASVWPSPLPIPRSQHPLTSSLAPPPRPQINNRFSVHVHHAEIRVYFQKETKKKIPTELNHNLYLKLARRTTFVSSWVNVLCSAKYGFIHSKHKREPGVLWRMSISLNSAGGGAMCCCCDLHLQASCCPSMETVVMLFTQCRCFFVLTRAATNHYFCYLCFF